MSLSYKTALPLTRDDISTCRDISRRKRSTRMVTMFVVEVIAALMILGISALLRSSYRSGRHKRSPS
jgi:hypothetical protein